MNACFVADAVRTPIGKHRGALKDVRPDDLLAIALREVIHRTGLDPAKVDEVYAGCANQAGEDNRNVARMATLLTHLPHSVPAVTVNRLCASGLEAIIQGARQIRLGEADVVIASGVESMTRAPWSTPKPTEAFPGGKLESWDTALGWRYPNPKLAALFPLEQMGETAENVAERLSISRDAQDAFALQSHQRAIASQQSGAFKAELVSVEIPQKKGAPIVVASDEQPRADTTIEKLASLRAAFREGGTVTAGNASTLNDGAAAVVLMTAEKAKALNLPVLAKIVGHAAAARKPVEFTIAPTDAINKLLQKTGKTVADVHTWEINEAFAVVSLANNQLLKLDPSKVNIRGGAVALGHPIGASGTRVLVTLLHTMKDHDFKRGVASLCIGGGEGIALMVER